MNRSFLKIAETLRESPRSSKRGGRSQFRNETARTLLVLLIVCMATTLASAGPGNYNQQGPKLVGTSLFTPQQGWSVSLSADGNTALVGGYQDNLYVGAAWVFTRTDGVWTEQAKLVGTGAVGQSEQGFSVALSGDGNTAVVGGRSDDSDTENQDDEMGGAVWVFTRSGNTWTQQGNKLVGTFTDGGGCCFVATWTQQGTSVAVSYDGNTIIEGGPGDDTFTYQCGDGDVCRSSAGSVWIFKRSGGGWTQEIKITGLDSYDDPRLGSAVAISADGNTVTARADHVDKAQVFAHSDGVWSNQGVLDFFSRSGEISLSSDGNIILASGLFFYRENGHWTQKGPQLNGPNGGPAIRLSGDGATAVGRDAGSVAVFVQSGGWRFHREYARSGSVAVSANGNTMVVGDHADDNFVGATWVFASPQLFATLTHSGNFTQGQMGATYTITAKNVGDRAIHAASTSAVNLVDRLPNGLTATDISGDGWSCTLSTLFCTRSDGLAVGATFPPVTVTVNVSSDAPASVTNSATASGGGSRWSTAKDVTNVGP